MNKSGVYGVCFFRGVMLSLLLAVICVVGCRGKKGGDRESDVSWEIDGQGRLVVVCYPPLEKGQAFAPERVEIIPLSQAHSVSYLQHLGNAYPPYNAMREAQGQEYIRFSLIHLEGEGEEGLYRVNFSVGQVKHSAEFRYQGEGWLPVASGERWYAAVIRDWRKEE